MSSAVLYLAIVAVWGAVLVPMWLRRDRDRIARLLHRRGDPEELPEIDEEPEDAPSPARRNARAAVIARRRRRTLGLGMLVLAATVAALAGFSPWWFALPPSALLTAHLWMLRVAAKLDAVRLRERRAAALREARLAEEEHSAEVIELPERPQEEVYDQYTDLRAVGH